MDGDGEPVAGEYTVRPVGRVVSPLSSLEDAPRQGDEGAPDAWVTFEPTVADALHGIEAGQHVIVVTWLDRADRDVLAVHPRGDTTRAVQGVFATRSPDRPNPIGLHRVEVLRVDGTRVQVRNLEAIDGTPVLDVKPLLADDVSLR